MATVDLNGWETRAGLILPTSGRKSTIVTLMDSTEAERGVLTNPLAVTERRKWQVLAAAASTIYTTPSNAAAVLALSGNLTGNGVYDRIVAAINVTAFTQTSGTDRSATLFIGTNNPSGADPTVYTICAATAFTNASALPKQVLMAAGVGTASGTGLWTGDFMDGLLLSVSMGAVASGTCSITLSYTFWAK